MNLKNSCKAFVVALLPILAPVGAFAFDNDKWWNNCHHDQVVSVPEGGSPWLYLALAAAALGVAIFFKSRKQAQASESA